MADLASLRPGDPEQVRGYRLTARLGEGGQGTVYLGVSATGARVAVKLLRADLTQDEEAMERFVREVSTTQRVAPFCTAAVIDTGVDQHRPYIISEYIDGPTLDAVVATEGPREGASLHRLAIGTVTALVAIHQAGIVHRDFKPSNVLLASDGPRVIDFGIAKALDRTSTLTAMAIGTPSYMTPEQLAGENAGSPADMFAWGCTMVFAATGQPPFGTDSLPAIFNRIMNMEPDLGAIADPALRDLVGQCLSKDATQRPAAGEALLRLLGHAGGTGGATGAAPPTAPRGILAEGSAAAAQQTGPGPGGHPGGNDPERTAYGQRRPGGDVHARQDHRQHSGPQPFAQRGGPAGGYAGQGPQGGPADHAHYPPDPRGPAADHAQYPPDPRGPAPHPQQSDPRGYAPHPQQSDPRGQAQYPQRSEPHGYPQPGPGPAHAGPFPGEYPGPDGYAAGYPPQGPGHPQPGYPGHPGPRPYGGPATFPSSEATSYRNPGSPAYPGQAAPARRGRGAWPAIVGGVLVTVLVAGGVVLALRGTVPETPETVRAGGTKSVSTPTPTPTAPTVPEATSTIKLPGSSLTLHESDRDPIKLSSYSLDWDKTLYVRKQGTERFVKNDKYFQYTVNAEGTRALGTDRMYDAQSYAIVSIIDPRSGSASRIRVTKAPVYPTLPQWSPDGRRGLVTLYEAVGDISKEYGFAIIDVATKKAKVIRVKEKDAGKWSYFWRGDGRAVGTWALDGKTQRIRFYDTQGTVLQTLLDVGTPITVEGDDISPSGSSLLTYCKESKKEICVWSTGSDAPAKVRIPFETKRLIGWYDDKHVAGWRRKGSGYEAVVFDFTGKVQRVLATSTDAKEYEKQFMRFTREG
ncbi:protein kinase domain-containing protein [Streptosporangium sp. G11]|uniref:serine/threonine protein kinase n=1 Tax=Streptosporangium sp. G11 TaxID=3436926 RepID=UPI003EBBAF93